jgi:hypothetical protein
MHVWRRLMHVWRRLMHVWRRLMHVWRRRMHVWRRLMHVWRRRMHVWCHLVQRHQTFHGKIRTVMSCIHVKAGMHAHTHTYKKERAFSMSAADVLDCHRTRGAHVGCRHGVIALVLLTSAADMESSHSCCSRRLPTWGHRTRAAHVGCRHGVIALVLLTSAADMESSHSCCSGQQRINRTKKRYESTRIRFDAALPVWWNALCHETHVVQYACC